MEKMELLEEDIRHIPIASLDPSLPPPSQLSIRAVVSLIWPYSSLNQTSALLLVEPDFRLRSRKGQVRVQLHGPAARELAPTHVLIGDVIALDLVGASWVEEGSHVKTPGRSVDGELAFRNKLSLRVFREGLEISRVVVDEPESAISHDSTSTPQRRPSLPAFRTPIGPEQSKPFSSPLRLNLKANPSPLNDSDDDYSLEEPTRKRLRTSGVWRYERWPTTPPEESREESLSDQNPLGVPTSIDAVPIISLQAPPSFAAPIRSSAGVELGQDSMFTPQAATDQSLPPIRTDWIDQEQSERHTPAKLPPTSPRLKPISSAVLPQVSPLDTLSSAIKSFDNASNEPSAPPSRNYGDWMPLASAAAAHGAITGPSPVTGRSGDITAFRSYPQLDRYKITPLHTRDYTGLHQNSFQPREQSPTPMSYRVIHDTDQTHGNDTIREKMAENFPHHDSVPYSLEEDIKVEEEEDSDFLDDSYQEGYNSEIDTPSKVEDHGSEEDVNRLRRHDSAELPRSKEEQALASSPYPPMVEKTQAETSLSPKEQLRAGAPIVQAHVNEQANQEHMAAYLSPADHEQVANATVLSTRYSMVTEDDFRYAEVLQIPMVGESLSKSLAPTERRSGRTQAQNKSFVEDQLADVDGLDLSRKVARQATPAPPLEKAVKVEESAPEVSSPTSRRLRSRPFTPEPLKVKNTTSSPALPVSPEASQAISADAPVSSRTRQHKADEILPLTPEPSATTSDKLEISNQSKSEKAVKVKQEHPAPLAAAMSSTVQSEEEHAPEAASKLGKRSKEVPKILGKWFTTARKSISEGTSKQATKVMRDPLRGLRTKLSYYYPLLTISQHLNNSSQTVDNGLDIIAVVTSPTSKAERAKAGAKDYYTILHVSDTSCKDKVEVQIFRPSKHYLPMADVGDIILLRGFVVKSRLRKCHLLSSGGSAWHVWRFTRGAKVDADSQKPAWARQHKGEATVEFEETRGPPVELGEEEQEHARTLRQWWEDTSGEKQVNVVKGKGKTIAEQANGPSV